MRKPIRRNSEIEKLLRQNGDIDSADFKKITAELCSIHREYLKFTQRLIRDHQRDVLAISDFELDCLNKQIQILKEMQKKREEYKWKLKISEISEDGELHGLNTVSWNTPVLQLPEITKDYSAVDKKLMEESKKAIAYLDSL